MTESLPLFGEDEDLGPLVPSGRICRACASPSVEMINGRLLDGWRIPEILRLLPAGHDITYKILEHHVQSHLRDVPRRTGPRGIDWSGHKNGKLTVVGRNNADPTGRGWICQCGACGETTSVSVHRLRKETTVDCGCSLRARRKEREQRVERRILFRSNPRLVALRKRFRDHEKNAQRRGLLQAVTFEAFMLLCTSPCRYCGTEGDPISIYQGGFKMPVAAGLVLNGIDRVDNGRGYEEGNMVPCCRSCNTAKGAMGIDEWDRWLARITRFRASLPFDGDPTPPRKGPDPNLLTRHDLPRARNSAKRFGAPYQMGIRGVSQTGRK